MSMLPILGKGLLVRINGDDVYQFLSCAGDDVHFESIASGRIYTTTVQKFFEAYASGEVDIVPAFVSESEIRYETKSDTKSFPAPLSDLPERWQRDLQRKLAYVRASVRHGATRGQLRMLEHVIYLTAKDIGDRRPPGASTVSYWMKQYQEADNEPAVLASKSAWPRKRPPRSAAALEMADQALREIYLRREGGSVRGSYRTYRLLTANENKERAALHMPIHPVMSERTFYRHTSNLNAYDVAVARRGYNAARAEFHMVRGKMEADRLMDYAEIDHSEINLFVIDDRAMLPLGRPKITAIKERKSSIGLGFYVSFAPSGLECISGALAHSLLDHKKAYEIWPELENPWPSHGRARTYVMDRGADFASDRCATMLNDLNAYPEWCERRTPWHKPSIERFFATMEQSLFEAMPGRTFGSIQRRGDYDPYKHAAIRFSTFVFLLHKWVVDEHNATPNSRTGLSPLEAWTELERDIPPRFPIDPAEIRIKLGLPFDGTLSNEGIRRDRLCFGSRELNAMFKRYGSRSVQCRMSFNDIGSVYVLHPDERRYIQVPCTDQQYASGLTVYQHKLIRQLAKEKAGSDAGRPKVLRKFKEVLQYEIREALAVKETKTKVRLARAANITSMRTLDAEHNSIAPLPHGQLSTPVSNMLLPEAVLPELDWEI
ncbi:hypothetical protein LMG19282_03839 [Cupriavidus campinensis]|uniref:DDE-type integrase/transposase/recombinase n=1 Tax=Cupriavidus campinensis TaxID=151783 RepID=A0AAE9L256_9BURK|nr:DDE-type integrase/transposase/recombinase [Cupriavidus campinensis]URF04004.1 DDE-type integrase/transposase/recombinase [Cupriavidus campinensis]CAG2150739.1 hypothetical protein LMG19282_03839 [Cupriavidus campinensis]